MLIAASFTVAGCSTFTPLHSPAAHTREATASAPAGYYTDAAANYAITFPGKPSVEPIEGSDTGAMRASYSTGPDPTAPNATYYTAGGTTESATEITPTDLEGDLLQLVNQGAVFTGQGKKFTVDGMPALMSDFTGPDGKPSAIVISGKGHRFYQLIVRGGTSQDRQTFFDSFKLLG